MDDFYSDYHVIQEADISWILQEVHKSTKKVDRRESNFYGIEVTP